MKKISIKHGLDIPIAGKPEGSVHPLTVDNRPAKPNQIALDFHPFSDIKPRLLKKVGEAVKIGEPLVEDKDHPERLFVSPAAGVVQEIRRGLKRRLLSIVIEVSENEEHHEQKPVNPSTASREMILEALCQGGGFAHIRQRPFDTLANPEKIPQAIFVQAIESAPFTPPQEMQVHGQEEAFQIGLTALSKLSGGKVYLVCREGTNEKAFTEAKGVETVGAEGPHPIANPSVHIHKLHPISHFQDVVWTLTAYDTMVIGHLLKTGRYYTQKVISIAGPGILDGKTGYFTLRTGSPIRDLIAARVQKGMMRFISGNVLTGGRVEQDDFLGFYDFGFAVVPENTEREMLHFFRPGIDKFTASRTYLSGWLDNAHRAYEFTTNQHGEDRGFIIASPYDKVMPLNIATMHLVKAVIAEDYDLAEELGLLEVAPEDFALATFVCPSKVDMVDIIRDGLKAHSAEVLG